MKSVSEWTKEVEDAWGTPGRETIIRAIRREAAEECVRLVKRIIKARALASGTTESIIIAAIRKVAGEE